jgi:hypothetical protein
MATDSASIQQALEEVTMIRRLIESVPDSQQTRAIQKITLSANLATQSVALIGCLGLIAVELFAAPSLTQIILVTPQEKDLQLYSIGCMAYILCVLLAVLYFVIWRASRHSGHSLESYVAKNFSYLKNMGLFTDLLVKFCVITLIFLAQKPEWIAPLLLLFTGHYLIQGHFFTLPLRLSLSMGALCMISAFTQFSSQNPQLIWALSIFAAMTTLSLSMLVLKQWNR